MEKKLAVILIALISLSCARSRGTEEEIRKKLKIPDSAKRVLIIGQSSHLDLDWMTSFENYYEYFVKNIFLSALDFLRVSDEHYYSIAEVSFIKRFIEDNPEGRGNEMINRIREGRFVVLGGGFSSPDNLLPDGEAIIMNYLKGRKYIEYVTGKRFEGFSVWLPDDFGHSPSLPDLLASMGYRYVGFARTDGMDSVIDEISGQSTLKDGSTAKRLIDERSIDFIWKGRSGEVIGHWMPFLLYCQGDSIDFIGQPLPGGFLGLYMGYDEEFTNSRMEEFINQLSEVSPTPYLFLPIGCDFTFPKMNLYRYAERWNKSRFKDTGVWVAVGSFEDYMKLVETHRDELKSYRFDMNPYFTGFYASRPHLKELFYKAEMNAIALEALLAFKNKRRKEMDEVWEKISFATHHDFVTGTSPIQVAEKEQVPLLREVLNEIDSIIEEEMRDVQDGNDIVIFNPYPVRRDAYLEVKLGDWSPPATFISIGDSGYGFVKDGILYAEVRDVPPFGFSHFEVHDEEMEIPFEVNDYGDELIMRTPFYEADFSKRESFYLKTLKMDGETLLYDSGIIKSYADDGGLWRIGAEMEGCSFTSVITSPPLTSLRYYLTPVTAYVEGEFEVEGERIIVDYLFFRTIPYVSIKVKGRSPVRRTVTFGLKSPVITPHVFTTVPHGIREITSQRFFTPTFWSTNGGIFFLDRSGGYSAVLNRPSGIMWNGRDEIEIVIFRNAPRERCESLGAVSDMTGQDWFLHDFKLTLKFLDGSEDEESLFSIVRSIQLPFFVKAGGFYDGKSSALEVKGCVPLMVKNAERMEGIILRALDFDMSGCEFLTDIYRVSEENLNSLEERADVLEDIIKNVHLIEK